MGSFSGVSWANLRVDVYKRQLLNCPREEVEYARKAVRRLDGSAQVSLADIATKSMCGNGTAVQATCSHTSPISPPPFMVGMACLLYTSPGRAG